MNARFRTIPYIENFEIKSFRLDSEYISDRMREEKNISLMKIIEESLLERITVPCYGLLRFKDVPKWSLPVTSYRHSFIRVGITPQQLLSALEEKKIWNRDRQFYIPFMGDFVNQHIGTGCCNVFSDFHRDYNFYLTRYFNEMIERSDFKNRVRIHKHNVVLPLAISELIHKSNQQDENNNKNNPTRLYL